MRKALTADFYDRSVLTVAPELLGKYLVSSISGQEKTYMITEVEAYDGPTDLACHAARGKTSRTEVMFGPAGVWYVYLIYGMYNMLNIVTGPNDYPAAVLIRGIEGFDGPGKLTRALEITRELNRSVAQQATGLWVEDRGVSVEPANIIQTPRIGVAYAGEWAQKPWRFLLKR